MVIKALVEAKIPVQACFHVHSHEYAINHSDGDTCRAIRIHDWNCKCCSVIGYPGGLQVSDLPGCIPLAVGSFHEPPDRMAGRIMELNPRYSNKIE